MIVMLWPRGMSLLVGCVALISTVVVLLNSEPHLSAGLL